MSNDYQYWNTSNNGQESPMIPTYDQQMQAKYADMQASMQQASNVNMGTNADIPNATMQPTANMTMDQSLQQFAEMTRNGTIPPNSITEMIKRKLQSSEHQKKESSSVVKVINIKITIEVAND